MTDEDRPRLAAALTALADVLGGTVTKQGHALYFDALSDLEWPAIQVACRRAVRECRFLPKPAELRNLAAGLPVEGLPARVEDEDRTERAWLAWRAAARSIGSYRSLLCEDGALAATLEAMFGGWPEACLAEFSDEMWASKRKEFGRVYRAFATQHEPRYLLGLSERQNRDSGLPQPAQVGVLEADGRVRHAALPAGSSPLALLGRDEVPALSAHDEPIARDDARSLLQRLRAVVSRRSAVEVDAP